MKIAFQENSRRRWWIDVLPSEKALSEWLYIIFTLFLLFIFVDIVMGIESWMDWRTREKGIQMMASVNESVADEEFFELFDERCEKILNDGDCEFGAGGRGWYWIEIKERGIDSGQDGLKGPAEAKVRLLGVTAIRMLQPRLQKVSEIEILVWDYDGSTEVEFGVTINPDDDMKYAIKEDLPALIRKNRRVKVDTVAGKWWFIKKR